MSATGRAVVTVAIVAAILVGGCRRARGPVIATLLEAEGDVQRSDGGRWSPAPAGHGFFIGDALRTGARSSARIAFAGGSVVRVAENGRVRFVRGALRAQPEPDLAIELGAAEIERAADDLGLLTSAGPARVQRGTHLRVHADGETATLEVLVGRAVLLDGDHEEAIEAGQGLRIKIGGAVLERFRVEVGAAIVEEAPAVVVPVAPTAPKALAPSAEEETTTTPPTERDRADVTLVAGESAVLHDGKPPLAVRLRFERVCPGGAVVELGGPRRPQRRAGAGAVVLRLPVGAHAYRVRCAGDPRAGKPRAAGVLTLKRDSGNVPLAKRAPANTIDADGRRYTVLYQTRLPALTLAWPAAPTGGGPLALHLDSAAGARVLDDRRPSQPLPAGALGEGTYTWWYSTADGRASPRTTLTIRFDNAAPTAQFFRAGAAPASVSPRAVVIDGVTMEGAKVSAGGQALAVDGRGRFRGTVPLADGDDAVAVKLEHPRSGVHYYIRR